MNADAIQVMNGRIWSISPTNIWRVEHGASGTSGVDDEQAFS